MSPLLLLLACTATEPTPAGGDTGGDNATADPAEGLVPLQDARLLRRLSLDLRGVVPTDTELDTLAADPAALATLRDAYLEDPRLEDALVSKLAERFLTRLDRFQVEHVDYALPDEMICEFPRSVGEEPLRLMARVVVEDRPWTDVVTQDHTVANAVLAETWPLELQADPVDGHGGWVDARWTDGRPAAGLLTSNGLWWRYVTSKANGNRSRAAAVSDLLLCDPILSRPVSFADTPPLTDEAATQEALTSNEYCLGCHAHVDPLASALFGFYPNIDYNPEELGLYHPEREQLGEQVLGVSSAYYGEPVEGLVDLGYHVATDPRFARCGVETFAQLMWRRPVELSDFDRIESLRTGFLDHDLQARALLRELTDTPEYRAGDVSADAPADVVDREQTRRMLSPDQLHTAVADLTGFSWEQHNCDLLANDELGFRIMAGGVDGDMVVAPQTEPGLTWALTVKRLAQAAALEVVTHDLVETTSTPRLLDRVVLADRPGSAAFTDQLVALHRRALAVSPDAEAQAGLEALWEAVYDTARADDTAGADDSAGADDTASTDDDAAADAWVAVVSALLRDPDFVTY